MIGVVISTFVIGATLNVMNKGLEKFYDTSRSWDISVPHEGVKVQQQHFQHARIHVIHSDKTTGTPAAQTSDERDAGQYTLLNAVGSHELADGKYLYNPQTQRIEVQWVQGIGSEKAAAPQARLMATVISGILSRQLSWGLVMLGVFLVIAIELLGIRSLSFAVGAYLSIATTLAIFCGGVMRWMVDRAITQSSGRTAETESEISPGSLYASGLIAAGGIVGLLGVALKAYENFFDKSDLLLFPATNPLHHDWVSVLMFALLAFSLYYFARKPLTAAEETGGNPDEQKTNG